MKTVQLSNNCEVCGAISRTNRYKALADHTGRWRQLRNAFSITYLGKYEI